MAKLKSLDPQKLVPIRLTVTPADRAKIRQAAGKLDLSMAEFVRQAAAEAADRAIRGKS